MLFDRAEGQEELVSNPPLGVSQQDPHIGSKEEEWEELVQCPPHSI